jgi:hypothetical protein
MGWCTLQVAVVSTFDLTYASPHGTGSPSLTRFISVDDELGNQFVATDDDNGGRFACSSLSKSLYTFDPEDEEFEQLVDLPRPRYRHSSAIVKNKVWLVGGRDLVDNLIPEVDVSKRNGGSPCYTSCHSHAFYESVDLGLRHRQ